MARITKRFTVALSPLSRIFQNEKHQAYGLLLLAVVLIGVKGLAGKEDVFSSVAHSYIEETAASVDEPVNQAQLADISDLSALNTGSPKHTPLTAAIQEYSVEASSPASTNYLDGFKADQIVEYTVQPGDNISSIAEDFGVSVNTIIWANSLKNPDKLTTGQSLKILPVSGVLHTVKKGDTIISIAKKYSADTTKIVSFNEVDPDATLGIGDQIIIPDGSLPGPVPTVKVTSTKGSSTYKPIGDGQCVAFVQSHGYAGMHGNAYQWARYINTNYPTVGGVVVFRGGRYGHVAIVTAVKANSIQIVEQNYYGPYIIDHREVSLDSKSIVGFIQ